MPDTPDAGKTGESLTAAGHDRLAKLLGLLDSEHDGERTAAGLQAARLIRSRGLTWPEVLAPRPALSPRFTPRDNPEFPRAYWGDPAPSAREMVSNLSFMLPEVTTKEGRFVTDLGEWLRAGGEPSPKQLAWLRAIYARVVGGQS